MHGFRTNLLGKDRACGDRMSGGFKGHFGFANSEPKSQRWRGASVGFVEREREASVQAKLRLN